MIKVHGYDHVTLYPLSRTFYWLRVERLFVYRSLSFGWKARAYICISIGIADTFHIRSLGVPCSNCIDDKHLAQLRSLKQPCSQFSYFQLSEMATSIACSILLELGYFLGVKKSSLFPSVKVKYLGYFSEPVKQTFTLSPIKFSSSPLFSKTAF